LFATENPGGRDCRYRTFGSFGDGNLKLPGAVGMARAHNMEVALDLYKNGEVTLWRAAEMAGLCLEEFKEFLATRSIRIEVGSSNEENLERLSKAGLL